MGGPVARVVDSRRVEISDVPSVAGGIPALVAKLEDLTVHTKPAAKVVVNERTGTIVMGGAVTISSCSILHGNLSIQVTTDFQVSQPAPLSQNGQTTVVLQSTVQPKEATLQVVQLKDGDIVEKLIR